MRAALALVVAALALCLAIDPIHRAERLAFSDDLEDRLAAVKAIETAVASDRDLARSYAQAADDCWSQQALAPRNFWLKDAAYDGSVELIHLHRFLGTVTCEHNATGSLFSDWLQTPLDRVAYYTDHTWLLWLQHLYASVGRSADSAAAASAFVGFSSRHKAKTPDEKRVCAICMSSRWHSIVLTSHSLCRDSAATLTTAWHRWSSRSRHCWQQPWPPRTLPVRQAAILLS